VFKDAHRMLQESNTLIDLLTADPTADATLDQVVPTIPKLEAKVVTAEL
jgi:hypothetical protein